MSSEPNGFAIGLPFDCRDALAERRRARVIADQAGRRGLICAVPGTRSLHGEPLGDPRHHLQLDAGDAVVRAVDDEGRVAERRRVVERELHVVPVHLVHGAVELQAMVEEFGLEADLVVGERVRRIAQRRGVLRILGRRRVQIRLASHRAVEAARPKALRVGVVHHHVGRDVPGQVAAALEAVVRGVFIFCIDAGGAGVASIGHIGATQRCGVLRSHLVLAVVVVARAARQGEHLRDDVEVDRA